MGECLHENRDYDPGDYVAPYGWDTYPGWYCADCGAMVDSDGESVPYNPFTDGDLAYKEKLEDEMRRSL